MSEHGSEHEHNPDDPLPGLIAGIDQMVILELHGGQVDRVRFGESLRTLAPQLARAADPGTAP